MTSAVSSSSLDDLSFFERSRMPDYVEIEILFILQIIISSYFLVSDRHAKSKLLPRWFSLIWSLLSQCSLPRSVRLHSR